ncbi:MAG: response regulator [Anaerolineae bacterium]|nr:response regulator [Anaerolineae bacterium]MDW8173772.1 response regulator [Anaerolineae bacterium]
MSSTTALVIDDTEANRQFFERLLAQASFQVIGAARGQDALKVAQEQLIDLAIVDIEIPDMSGLELLGRLRRLHPEACMVVATMHDEQSLMASAFSRGADVFLVKPHGFVDLFRRLQTQGALGLHESRPLVIDQYGVRGFSAYSG